jgi:hypothetical protein
MDDEGFIKLQTNDSNKILEIKISEFCISYGAGDRKINFETKAHVKGQFES